MKFFKNQELILLVLLLTTTFLMWFFITRTQFEGEGFVYFTPELATLKFFPTLAYDFFARVIFQILPNLFGGKVYLYMWFQLAWMILTDIAFYLMVRIVTKNRFIALLATFFFSLSYVGKYDMYSIGGYQYFVQRAVILLPQLVSFIFLSLYLSRGTYFLSCYFLSLLMYTLSIVMGFFGSWFLPFFVFYPFFYFVFNLKIVKKHFWRIIWTPIPFLVINLLIIGNNNAIPEQSIQSFIVNNLVHIAEGISQQIAALTPGLGEILKRYHQGTLQFEAILSLTIILYVVAFAVIYKVNTNLRALAAASLVSLAAILLFNIYLNEANVLRTFGSSRYFYFPFAMVALFWSLFFYSVAAKGRFYFVLLLIFCSIWLFYNFYRINENRKADAWIQKANKDTISYVQKLSVMLKDGSVVQLPANIGGYGERFITRFYEKPGTKFSMEINEPLSLEKLAEQNVDVEKVYILHFDPKTQTVVDQTESIRKQILELKKKL